MTENPVEQTTQTTADASDKPRQLLDPKSKTSRYGLGTGFALSLALLALGACGYNYMLNLKLQRAQQVQFGQKFTPLEQNLTQLETKLSERQGQLAQLEQRLDNLSQIKDQNTWQLQEVAYLLQLADLNLKYQHDPEAALDLLLQADAQIAKLNQPKLIQLRQMLARDITSVRAVQTVDITGALTKLQALSEAVSNLPQRSLEPDQALEQAKSPTTPPVSAHWWQKIAQQTWQVIQSLVTIRHYNETHHPILTQEQQFLLTSLIQFHLAQAQWAAIHYNQDLYQQNLQRAVQLTQTSFGNSPQKIAFSTELKELQSIHLTVVMPELTNTIATVNQLAATQGQGQQKDTTLNKSKTIPQESALV